MPSGDERSAAPGGDIEGEEVQAQEAEGAGVSGETMQQLESGEDMAQALDHIDASLLRELDDDARYASSVEEPSDRDDLDFIQMTGLTPPAPYTSVDHAQSAEDIDPNAPISFAEAGVEDVDAARDPFANGDDTISIDTDHEFLPERPPESEPPKRKAQAQPPSRALDDLTAIVEELEGTYEAPNEDEIDDGAEDAAAETGAEMDPAPDDVESGDYAWAINEDREVRAALTAFGEYHEAAPHDEFEPITPPDTAEDEAEDPEVSESVVAAEESLPPQAEEPVVDAAADDDRDAPKSLGELEAIVQRLGSRSATRKPVSDSNHDDEAGAIEHVDKAIDAPSAEDTDDPVETPSGYHLAPVGGLGDTGDDADDFDTNDAAFDTASSVAPRNEDEFKTESEIDAPSVAEWPAAEDDAFDDYGAPADERRRRTERPGGVARGVRTLVILAAGAGVVAAAYFGRQYVAAYSLSDPAAAHRQAVARLNDAESAEEFAAASNEFLRIHREAASLPVGAQSLFDAAFALSATPPAPRGPAEEAYRASIALFEQFIDQYPDHEKIGRAHSLVGRLLYETGDYQAAIQRLSDPMQRERDPVGYLASLRIRAQAHDAAGNLAAAASDLKEAAIHPDNYKPHKDYLMLADMYRKRARSEADPAERQAYQQRVIDVLQQASNLHGLDRDERRDITNQLQAERSLLVAAARVQTEDTAAGAPQPPRRAVARPVDVPARESEANESAQ